VLPVEFQRQLDFARIILLFCNDTKIPAFHSVSGGPNCGWLKALKNSARNSRCIPSLNLFMKNSFRTERLAVFTPGERTLVRLRGALPIALGSGTVTTSGLVKYLSRQSDPVFLSSVPVRFGRWPP